MTVWCVHWNWCHFNPIVTGIHFGVVYFYMELANDDNSFKIAPEHVIIEDDSVLVGFELLSLFLYFSFTIQTLVGFGDITPFSAPSCGVVSCQTCLAVLYSAVFVAQTLSNIEEDERLEQEEFEELVQSRGL
jgi:hypothetical protein